MNLKPQKLPPLSIKLKPGLKPIRKKPYATSAVQRDAIRETVQELLDGGQIVPSCSEWSSPTHLVKRKDGRWRMVVDYRGLNSVIQGQNYPLPNIQENISRLRNSRYFATFDMFAGYEQVRVQPSDQHLTSFVTPDAQYEYIVAPYGINTIPSHFSHCMDIVLSDLRWNGAMQYLDDTILHHQTESGLLQLATRYFERCQKYSIQL